MADNDALIYELNNLPMVAKGSQFDGWLLSNATLETILAALRTPQPEPAQDAVERACDAFMNVITVDGNGGIEFLEEGITAAIAAMRQENK